MRGEQKGNVEQTRGSTYMESGKLWSGLLNLLKARVMAVSLLVYDSLRHPHTRAIIEIDSARGSARIRRV